MLHINHAAAKFELGSTLDCGDTVAGSILGRPGTAPSIVARMGFVLACALTLAACNSVNVSPERPSRTPEQAARQTIDLEPGPPPPAKPLDGSNAMRFARRQGGSEATANFPGLQLSESIIDLGDTWERLRAQLTIKRPLNKAVLRELNWFRKNQDYLTRMTERARMYLPYILRETESRSLPVELALLPVIESAYQPFATSPAAAAGIWQFIPSTARVFKLKNNWWYDGRRDVVDSTRAALDYLSKLSQDFDGDWLLATASYNWGEGNVGRARKRAKAAGKKGDFWSLRVPSETRVYVPRWLAFVELVARPEHYGVQLVTIPDVEYFETVHLDGQIDLTVRAVS